MNRLEQGLIVKPLAGQRIGMFGLELKGSKPVTLIDFKAGIEDASRGVITSLDWVLLVIDPSYAGVQTAATMKTLLDQMHGGAMPATWHLQSPGLVQCLEDSYRHARTRGVAFGLSLHSISDGLAMAAAVASTGDSHGAALGLGAALAVILHKPFGALAITTLMTAGQEPPATRHLVNLGFALVTPMGAMLFYLGAGPWAHAHPGWLGGALAFCAGTFLCIACADLPFELLARGRFGA